MNIASRTPEGEFNRCAICGKKLRITPSDPAGDAPCPHCGVLLWFLADDDELPTLGPNRIAIPLAATENSETREAKPPSPLTAGDRVRIIDGEFEAFEATVEEIDPNSGYVMVVIEVYGKRTPIDLLYWQVRKLSV